MKRIISILFVMALAVSLSACGLKEKDMAKPDDSGNYNYSNDSLYFSLVLPKEFQYYQTQRKETSDYAAIEFFVPTSDKKYPQEVPSYAKPVVVKVFKEKAWDEKRDKTKNMEVLGKGNGQIYTMIFWEKFPADWEAKWSDGTKDSIMKSFKID